MHRGGKFTLSDDSHGIAQVATNYLRALVYLEGLGVSDVWTWERVPPPGGSGHEKAALVDKKVSIATIKQCFT